MDHILAVLSQSSGVPSTSERREIEEMLEQSITEMDGLEAEMERVLLQQAALNKRIQACRDVLAPVRHLNRDMLQEIFLNCLPTKHNTVMSVREAPLLLMLVCRHWQDVAINTAGLWASVHIVIPSQRTVPRVPNFIGAIDSWLMKSKSLPIDISFGMERFSHAFMSIQRPEGVVDEFLKVAASYCNRWGAISLPRTSITNIEALAAELSLEGDVSPLPMLHTLHISSEHG